jgi:hypothetical protein
VPFNSSCKTAGKIAGPEEEAIEMPVEYKARSGGGPLRIDKDYLKL